MENNLLTFMEACCFQFSVSRHRSRLYWNQFAYVSFVLPKTLEQDWVWVVTLETFQWMFLGSEGAGVTSEGENCLFPPLFSSPIGLIGNSSISEYLFTHKLWPRKFSLRSVLWIEIRGKVLSGVFLVWTEHACRIWGKPTLVWRWLFGSQVMHG